MKYLFVNAAREFSKIDRNIYGHFSEHLGRGIYGGIYVGEDSKIPNVRGIRADVVEALKNIRVPVIRWPGGCFAEYYNWRDGIGPLSGRKHIVNTGWGGVVEDNSFGTHEFMDFCGQIGCSPYIAGNVGSGTVRELSDWVEYLNFDGHSPMADLRRENGREEPWGVKYIGIGNENWACGGSMCCQYYSNLFKQYATYIRAYAGTVPYKIACGPDGADYDWTDTLMRSTCKYLDGLSLHYYTMPGYYPTDEYKWEKKTSAVDFDEGNYYRTLRRALFMDELIRRHKCVMDKHDPGGRVSICVDEWGTWHAPEPGTNPAFLYQQNTMRDAIVAAVTLNIFNSHSDRVRMANLAQMINVLQSVILTGDSNIILTPTYHVFDLYKGHQDAMLVESYVQQDLTGTDEAGVPALHASASKDGSGAVRITLVNLSLSETQDVSCMLSGRDYKSAAIRYLHGGMNEHNTFEQADNVAIKEMPPIDIKDNCLKFEIPSCSVFEILIS